jgi:hypothetical protein
LSQIQKKLRWSSASASKRGAGGSEDENGQMFSPTDTDTGTHTASPRLLPTNKISKIGWQYALRESITIRIIHIFHIYSNF